MNEKKLIAVVVIVAFCLCGILSLGIVCRSQMKSAARAKDIAILAETLDRNIAKSNELLAKREFEPATAGLRELEPKITAMDDASLEQQLQRAMWDIADAKRDYKAKLDQGYSVFQGQFISMAEKDRILAERERAQAAERERVAAEARARAEQTERERAQAAERERLAAEAGARAEQERREEEQRWREQAIRLAEAKLPGYEVVLDDSSDTPIKTQVELRITLDKRPSESELRALLRSLYEKAKKRSGFKFRAHPSAVYIYAFAKKNYHKNSGASWIGMLSYVPDDKEPTISVNSSSLKAQFEQSSTRFGLTKSKRKRIYWELFKITDKAQREADRKVPNPKTLEDFTRQAGEFNKFHARYLKLLLRKYRITDKQRVQITVEGVQKNWPYPSP